jgi:hypothetical protein
MITSRGSPSNVRAAMNDNERIVYSLNVEDIQTVSRVYLERELTEREISILEDAISDYIDWTQAFENAISDKITLEEKRAF